MVDLLLPALTRADTLQITASGASPKFWAYAAFIGLVIVFLALDQLPALLGLTEEEARQMADGFTVYNPTAAVNPLAAPDQVLAAVPGITQRDRADIAAARKSAAGSKDLRLKQVIDRANGLLAIASPSVFIIEVRIDGGDGVLQGSRARAVVRLEPNGALPFGTLALEED